MDVGGSVWAKPPRYLRAVGARNFEKYRTFLLEKRDFPVTFTHDGNIKKQWGLGLGGEVPRYLRAVRFCEP